MEIVITTIDNLLAKLYYMEPFEFNPSLKHL